MRALPHDVLSPDPHAQDTNITTGKLPHTHWAEHQLAES